MPLYNVTGVVVGSTWVGEYYANDAWQAIEFARDDAGVSLCHECARKISDPEVLELTAEDVETGDATSEKTVHDQIAEQAKEIERLREAVKLGMHYLKGRYPIPVKEAEVLAKMQAALDAKDKP